MICRCSLAFAAALVWAVSGAGAAEQYRNPVIDGNLADPAVIFHEGTYYLYATGEVDGDNGYRAYTSKDLVHWQRGPVVFRTGEPHVWAPDVWRDPDSGRFYLYYTANKTVGVADAAGPLGPFAVRRKLFDDAIDAHLFRDDDGRLYLYYVALPGFRITVQPMADPVTPQGEPKVVLQPESEWEIRNGRVTEGPWMIKHDGRCCLLYSGSGANTPDYAVGYATSDSPLGPFTRAEENPILHRSEGLFGPGHGCAIQDAKGQWWFVYHQKRTDRREWDRFISIDRLQFDEQGRLHGQATRGSEQPAPATQKM
jgi:beta-xylosidase